RPPGGPPSPDATPPSAPPRRAARRRPAPSASVRRSRRTRTGPSSSAERPPQRLDCLGDEPVIRPGPAAARLDETGLAQDLQMVRHGRLRELEGGSEVADAELIR